MWMSELAQRSGLSVATVKFYLREGLLHPGEATGATRARYDASHVRRLRLVRALTEVAGMRLDAVRAVLAAVDDDTLPLHEVLGAAHTRLSAEPEAPPSPAALERVDSWLRRQRWRLAEHSRHRLALARALDALAGLEVDVPAKLLDDYAGAMRPLARREVRTVPTEDRATAAEHVVVGTLLLEPVLLLVRRIAQENASRRRFGPR